MSMDMRPERDRHGHQHARTGWHRHCRDHLAAAAGQPQIHHDERPRRGRAAQAEPCWPARVSSWSSHSAETSSRDLDQARPRARPPCVASSSRPRPGGNVVPPVQAGESVEEHQVIAVFQPPKGGAGCTTLASEPGARAPAGDEPASGPRRRKPPVRRRRRPAQPEPEEQVRPRRGRGRESLIGTSSRRSWSTTPPASGSCWPRRRRRGLTSSLRHTSASTAGDASPEP